MSQRARAGLAALALALQLAVLYAPRAPAVDTGGLPVDKLVHLVAFAAPTAALIAAGLPRGWVIGVMIVHAPLSELIQGRLLSDRSGDPWDVVADLAGVAIGAFLSRRAPGARTGLEPTARDPMANEPTPGSRRPDGPRAARGQVDRPH